MRKIITATTLLAMSQAAIAHECNVNFDGTLTLENSILTITTDKDDIVVIDQYRDLSVNGSNVSLNSQQQQWLDDYYNGINQAAPAVAEIALDGVAIATEAVGHVFGELLGSDSYKVDQLTEKLNALGEEVQNSFYAEDGSIRLNSKDFEEGDLLGDKWEAEFEEAVEELVMSSMGQLLVSIGTEMLFSGGDMEAFEQRMENFGEEIEQKMEFRGEEIEKKADALCLSLVKVDFAENQLQSSVSELSDLNVLQVRDNKHSM